MPLDQSIALEEIQTLRQCLVTFALLAVTFVSAQSPSKSQEDNGISVGLPKVFDNRSLAIMMDSLADSLKNLQVVDQTPLRNALGLLQGSQVHDTSTAFSILAGGTPEVVTSLDNSTQADTENKKTSTKGTDNGTPTDTIEKIVDKTLSQKLGLTQQTTVAARNPSVPDLPDLIAAPSQAPAFGQNALDLLSDQVNLTYQIFNVRMLLERSLTDRLMGDGNPRLQTVLGFNVSLDPPRDATDSAAVVEITISEKDSESPSLVALMPQEKTYNSVALSSKSNAFGGSAVVKMITVGYSQRRRGQTYYLYRDNDTISFERIKDAKSKELTFGWEFRPVLGRRSVSPGMRQMLAVVSLPHSDAAALSENVDLEVTVKTYWRKYYGDTLTTSDHRKIGAWPYIKKVATLGTSESIPNGSVMNRKESVVHIPTTNFYQEKLRPTVSAIRWTQVDDKTAIISVTGDNFFTGTSVAMGGTSSATNVVVKSPQAMDILTPVENIGAGDAMIVGRYGGAVPLSLAGCQLMIDGGKLTPPFAGQRELELKVKWCGPSTLDSPLALFIDGKHVPGIPVVRFTSDSTATVLGHIPTNLIPKGEGTIMIVNPFHSGSRISFPWYDDPYAIKRTSGKTRTVLYISRNDGVALNDKNAFGDNPAWKVEYDGTNIVPVLDSGKMMRVELPTPDADGLLALYEPKKSDKSSTLYLLDIPPAKPKLKAAIEAASGTTLTITQNDAPKLDFSGEKVDAVASVQIEGQDKLHFEYDAEKKILSVYLTSAATKSPAKLTLQFRDSSSKLLAALALGINALPKQGSFKQSESTAERKK